MYDQILDLFHYLFLSYLNNVFRHILLCNLLTTILRPNFEEPLDTAQQLVEKNITLIVVPAGNIWKEILLDYNILGENMIVPDDWDQFDIILEQGILGAGTHAYLVMTTSEMNSIF